MVGYTRSSDDFQVEDIMNLASRIKGGISWWLMLLLPLFCLNMEGSNVEFASAISYTDRCGWREKILITATTFGG